MNYEFVRSYEVVEKVRHLLLYHLNGLYYKDSRVYFKCRLTWSNLKSDSSVHIQHFHQYIYLQVFASSTLHYLMTAFRIAAGKYLSSIGIRSMLGNCIP